MSKQIQSLTYKQRIQVYNKAPTKCAYCGDNLSYSDLRPLAAAITKTPEICEKAICINWLQNLNKDNSHV